MIDPKRLERIWAACPELRPDLGGSPLEYLPEEPGQAASGWWSQMCSLSEHIVDAIVRDRIIWWLAERALGLTDWNDEPIIDES